MKSYSRAHLSDETLLRDLAAATTRERGATTDVLALIAEVDSRKLYLPAGYPSMFAYCIGELHYCEQAAYKRITAARLARRFPTIFAALAHGRLHLSGVVLLAAHLTEDTADELLAAAEHKTKSEIESLLAARFPKSDLLAWVEPIPASEPQGSKPVAAGSGPCQLSPGRVESVHDVHKVAPLSPQSFALQCTLSHGAREKLRYAQELLSHQIPGGDIATVIEHALDALIPQLEKRKFAATSRPRRAERRGSTNPRHIPAHVMRAVWERDGGQCTFVSEAGHRCAARKRLEFDHALEVARGGESTIAGIRLRCRTHNQYGAERTFGAEFMRHRRTAAAEARAAARATRAATRNAPPAPVHVEVVVPWLRALGFTAAEARRAAERCADMPDASLEERVRSALASVHVRGARHVPAPESREMPVPRAAAAPSSTAGMFASAG